MTADASKVRKKGLQAWHLKPRQIRRPVDINQMELPLLSSVKSHGNMTSKREEIMDKTVRTVFIFKFVT